MNDRELLAEIRHLIGVAETADDCAALPLGDGRLLLASTDMLHAETDFPAGMTEYQKGWMSVAVSLSDIASSGAQPVSVLVAAGLDNPSRLLPFMEGACACAETYGAKVSGGDIDSHTEFTVVTTAFGTVDESVYCPRSGARIGDLIGMTGIPGRAQMALDGYAEYTRYLYMPEPEVVRGQLLARLGVSAMMDVSDGLALSLWDMSEASGRRFAVESERIPFADATPYAKSCGIFGGGDFGLLFTFPPELKPEIERLDCRIIGEVCNGNGVTLDGAALEKRGYSHTWQ